VAKSTVNGENSGKHVTDEPIPPAVTMQGIQDLLKAPYHWWEGVRLECLRGIGVQAC